MKNTLFYKKFFKDCLNIIYNSENNDNSFVLSNLIETLILCYRKKYTFGKYTQFDKEKNSNIKKQLRK